MGLMDDVIESDSLAFVDVDAMPGAEAITVTPKGAAARSVSAQVFRNPPERMGSDGVVKKPNAVIIFRNHATAGITPAELATGLTVTFKLRKDTGTAQTFNAYPSPDGENNDAGMVMVEI